MAVATAAKEFEGWAPNLISLITECDVAPVPQMIMALPVEHRWNRIEEVTLLGDAAHLMSPFAGEGAISPCMTERDLESRLPLIKTMWKAPFLEYESGLRLCEDRPARSDKPTHRT